MGDTMEVVPKTGVLDPQLSDDTPIANFVRLTEDARRERERLMDAGDETAALHFQKPQQQRQDYGGWQGYQNQGGSQSRGGGGYNSNRGGDRYGAPSGGDRYGASSGRSDRYSAPSGGGYSRGGDSHYAREPPRSGDKRSAPSGGYGGDRRDSGGYSRDKYPRR